MKILRLFKYGIKGYNKIRRIENSCKKLEKAIKRKEFEKSLRIEIENNPKINIFNYPFYRIRRKLRFRNSPQVKIPPSTEQSKSQTGI